MSFATPANFEFPDDDGGYECKRCGDKLDGPEDACARCEDRPQCHSCSEWSANCCCAEDDRFRNLTTDEGQNVSVKTDHYEAYQDVRAILTAQKAYRAEAKNRASHGWFEKWNKGVSA